MANVQSVQIGSSSGACAYVRHCSQRRVRDIFGRFLAVTTAVKEV